MPHTLHLKKFVQPGEPPINVMSSHHTSIGSHDHDFYELTYVEEGYCLHHVNGLNTLLMEGDIFIIRPGVQHYYSGNRVVRIYNCIFGAEALALGLDEIKKLPGLELLLDETSAVNAVSMHLSLNERNAFIKPIKAMQRERSETPLGWKLRLPAVLTQLLVEFGRAYQSRENAGMQEDVYPEYVRHAMAAIDAQYGNCDLTIHRVAEQVGVSDDYLTRQFRRVTGISTQEYLRRYRFARAMELLQAGSPIGEVAARTGFRTLSYFSREFSRELGITPSQYKNQSKE